MIRQTPEQLAAIDSLVLGIARGVCVVASDSGGVKRTMAPRFDTASQAVDFIWSAASRNIELVSFSVELSENHDDRTRIRRRL